MIAYLGRSLGVSDGESRRIADAALLHDIGKFAVPIELLQKSTPLSAAEFALVRAHPQAGYDILHTTGNSMMALAAEIALHHHERYDGSGYPHGLAGEAIPLPARIAAVCDVYDALRQHRPYRPGRGYDEAMSIIMNGDGRTLPSHFEPRILLAFQRISDDARKVFEGDDGGPSPAIS